MTSPAPSPSLLLSALRAHLLPEPILAVLPTTLQLFAHFTLLSSKLSSEASRALDNHDALMTKLEAQGISDRETTRLGALKVNEGKRLKRVKERDLDQRGFAFSIEFRKYHIAIMLSTKINPSRLDGMINTYFPDLTQSSAKSHDRLYIRDMTEEQIRITLQYRATVLEWSNEAKEVFDAKQPPLNYSYFYPKDKDANGDKRLKSLSENIVKEAENVIKDIQAFEDIFGPVIGIVNGQKNELELEVKVEEMEDDSRMKGKGKGKEPVVQYGDTRNSSQAGPSRLRPSDSPSCLARTTATVSRSRTSSHSRISLSNSPTPSPEEKTAKCYARRTLGSFSNDAYSANKETSIRYSLTGNDDNDNPEIIDLTESLEDQPALASKTTSQSHASKTQAPQLAPAQTTHTQLVNIKKRPRPRHSDPLGIGPDYTIQEKTFGENHKGHKIRPFDNEEFYKNNKKPRTSMV